MADSAHTPVVQGPSRIFLARHGQSEFNAEGRISGQLDPPLTAKGRKQAQLLARALDDERISSIYTSDLVRARETAAPTALAHGLPIRLSAALREIDLGVLQGRFRDERDPEAERLWRARASDPGTYRPPGGESFADLDGQGACLSPGGAGDGVGAGARRRTSHHEPGDPGGAAGVVARRGDVRQPTEQAPLRDHPRGDATYPHDLHQGEARP